jgi:hypothetical protein
MTSLPYKALSIALARLETCALAVGEAEIEGTDVLVHPSRYQPQKGRGNRARAQEGAQGVLEST